MKTRGTHRHRRGLYAPELLEPRIAPATFVVTNLTDAAVGSLRNVIGVANATPGADTITFDPAILPGTIVLSAEINILDTLTIKGPGIDVLAVSGNDLVRIFNIGDGTATQKPTTITGLTLTDGRTAGDGGALVSTEPLTLKNVVIRSSYAGNDGGGAFVNTTGKISIASSQIVHNQAINGGGGLYLRSGAGISIVKTTIADNIADNGGGLYAQASGAKSVVLIDTAIISGNTATGDNGGGLQLRSVADARFTVKNSLITGNTAAGAGGGLYAAESILTIAKTTFSNNTAKRGGGIGSDGGKTLTISASRFLGNRATEVAGPGGGALYLEGPNTVVKISNTLFSANISASYGGAIANEKAATLTIAGSSFLGNIATDDGGAIKLSDGAVLTMKNSTLSGNTSGSFGGAIAADSAGVLDLAGNKFTENKAVIGGAVSVAGLAAGAASAKLGGNLFQANVANSDGGAVVAQQGSVFSSKADRLIGNVALAGQGGGVSLVNAGGIIITGSLFQGNVAVNNSGGGLSIAADAVLSGVKVLDNIAGPGARGGGLRIAGGTVVIAKSVITGNIANDGGGVFYTIGTTTFDAATLAKTKGNAARINPNIGSA